MSKHIEAIEKALEYAKNKHPFFAHEPIEVCDEEDAERKTAYWRRVVEALDEEGRLTGTSILTCEMWEAIEAYAKRDYDACLEELAQCAAVVVRMMEMVEKERSESERE